ncbi:hypothetical protein AGMMS49938_13630 [Fibrobacterales bacterium]|nr:hypothetical protein AGMMS49938_13630 [Fibrobacterales bacterium]
MSKIFPNGMRIELQNGQAASIISPIKDGGQGQVYKVKIASKIYALKWYKKVQDEKFQKNLVEIIEKLQNFSKCFVMPLYICKERDGKFG